MTATEIITLQIPRADTEALFLQLAVQAAIQAYRNDKHDNISNGETDWTQKLTGEN